MRVPRDGLGRRNACAPRRNATRFAFLRAGRFEGLVELPTLCVPPLDDPAVPRLEALLQGAFAERSGYLASAGGDKALTYGELSAAGILQHAHRRSNRRPCNVPPSPPLL